MKLELIINTNSKIFLDTTPNVRNEKLLQIANLIFNTLNSNNRETIDFDTKIKYAFEMFQKKEIKKITLNDFLLLANKNFEKMQFSDETSLKINWVKDKLFELNQSHIIPSCYNELLFIGLLKFFLIDILLSKNSQSALSLSYLQDLIEIKYSLDTRKLTDFLSKFFSDYLKILLDSIYENKLSLTPFNLDQIFYISSCLSNNLFINLLKDKPEYENQTRKISKEFINAFRYLPEKNINNKVIKIFDNNLLDYKILFKICNHFHFFEKLKNKISFCIEESIIFNNLGLFLEKNEHDRFSLNSSKKIPYSYIEILELFNSKLKFSHIFKDLFYFLGQSYPHEMINDYYANSQYSNLIKLAINSFNEDELYKLTCCAFQNTTSISKRNLLAFIIEKKLYPLIYEYLFFIKTLDISHFYYLITHENSEKVFEQLCCYLTLIEDIQLLTFYMNQINKWLLKENDFFYFNCFAEIFSKNNKSELNYIDPNFLTILIQQKISKNVFLNICQKIKEELKDDSSINFPIIDNKFELMSENEINEIITNILLVDFFLYEGFNEILQRKKGLYSFSELTRQIDNNYKIISDTILQKRKLTFSQNLNILIPVKVNLYLSICSLLINKQVENQLIFDANHEILELLKLHEKNLKIHIKSFTNSKTNIEFLNELYQLLEVLMFFLKNFEIKNRNLNKKLLLLLFSCSKLLTNNDIEKLLQSNFFHIAIDNFFRTLNEDDPSCLAIFNFNEVINLNFFKKILINSKILQDSLFINFLKVATPNEIKNFTLFFIEHKNSLFDVILKNEKCYTSILKNEKCYPLIFNETFPENSYWRYQFLHNFQFPKELSSSSFSHLFNFIFYDRNYESIKFFIDFFMKLNSSETLSFLNQNIYLLNNFFSHEIIELINLSKIYAGYNRSLELFIINSNNIYPNLYHLSIQEFIELGIHPQTNFFDFVDRLKILSENESIKISYNYIKEFFTKIFQIHENDSFYFKNIELFCKLGNLTDLELIDLFIFTLHILTLDRLPGLSKTNLFEKIKLADKTVVEFHLLKYFENFEKKSALTYLENSKHYINELIGKELTELLRKQILGVSSLGIKSKFVETKTNPPKRARH